MNKVIFDNKCSLCIEIKKKLEKLDRKNKFDEHKKSYAFEELIAETGSILFGKHFKIAKTIRPCHATYLNSWIKALENDFRFLTSAIAQASRAYEYYVK